MLGSALAQAGKPREAVANVEQGIALAQSLNQPSSSAHAFMNAMMTYQVLDDRAAVLRTASQMREIADKFNLPLQRSLANFFAAWANACGDDRDAQLRIMDSEFARVSLTAPLPQQYAGLLASVRLEAGQAARALEPLDMILQTLKEPGVGFYVPEIHRLRGECLLRLDASGFDDVVREFDAAIAAAKQQHARIFQLRAAIGLARACKARGVPEQGAAPLREAAGLFGNGDSDVPELAAARQFLAAHAR